MKKSSPYKLNPWLNQAHLCYLAWAALFCSVLHVASYPNGSVAEVECHAHLMLSCSDCVYFIISPWFLCCGWVGFVFSVWIPFSQTALRQFDTVCVCVCACAYVCVAEWLDADQYGMCTLGARGWFSQSVCFPERCCLSRLCVRHGVIVSSSETIGRWTSDISTRRPPSHTTHPFLQNRDPVALSCVSRGQTHQHMFSLSHRQCFQLLLCFSGCFHTIIIIIKLKRFPSAHHFKDCY